MIINNITLGNMVTWFLVNLYCIFIFCKTFKNHVTYVTLYIYLYKYIIIR